MKSNKPGRIYDNKCDILSLARFLNLSVTFRRKINYLQIDIVYSTSFLSVDTEKSRAS